MSSPGTRVIEYVLSKLDAEPVAKRAELYRALAAIAPTTTDRRRFDMLAADCEAVDAAHEQLVLDFKRRMGRE